MRRKLHSNQHKRIRKAIEGALEASGMPFSSALDRVVTQVMTPSKRFNVSVRQSLDHGFPNIAEDWCLPEQVFEGAGLLSITHPDSPHGIYKRVKKRVQTFRHQERSGLLRELRDRVRGRIVESVEHARTAALQREYAAVPGVQGMGLPDTEEG